MTKPLEGQVSMLDPGLLCGRTYPAPSAATKEPTSKQCSKPCAKSATPTFQYLCLKRGNGKRPAASWATATALHGEPMTLNFGECPSAERGSTLSQILEANAPEKYYLSAKACAGILRRAMKRGKTLPPMLWEALTEVVLMDRQSLRASESGTNQAQDVVYAIEGNTVDRASNKNGKGWCEGVTPTLNTQDRHAVLFRHVKDGVSKNDGTAGTIRARIPRDRQDIVCYPERTGALCANSHPGSYTGQDAFNDMLPVIKQGKTPRKYIVRRLTPLECCRLQGFPDWWEEGVEGSDSARYKMWGNGIALPCAVDVLWRSENAYRSDRR